MSVQTKVVSDMTPSGLPVKEVYGPSDVADLADRLGAPGEFPFTRGIQRTMYRGRLWTIRQYAGFGTPEESNARYRWLLDQGQTGLSVALDLPSQIGFDSDDPEAEEEVGRVGCAIDTLDDMERLFAGIPLGSVSTSFTVNGTAAIMLAMYVVVGEKQGVPPAQLRGTMQNDILKEYVARGTWIFPPEPSLRLIVDAIEFCARSAPKFHPISIAGAHFRDAGATAVQELAFTLADGITYVERCLDRGLGIDEVGPILSFFFYTHSDLFEEVAKYRAGRRLWAEIMRDRFGARDPRSMMFRVGCVCGGSSLTAEQPMNNIVRVAYEALAAVLGGVQSIFTAAWDEAFTLPSEQSAELALRTQQILAYETGVARVVDPLGGSYYVEALTHQFEQAVRTKIAEIERRGGMVQAIERGEIQAEIAQEAYEFQRQVEAGDRIIIGVNRFQRPEASAEIEFYQVRPEQVERQRERLRQIRTTRDALRARQALDNLRRAAENPRQNLIPVLMDAVKAYCTVGEMTRALKDVFGEWREPVTL